MSRQKIKAVFVDRDGVINHDPGDYTTTVDEFRFLPGVIEALQSWTEAGFAIIVITNQGGLVKKRYTLSDFHDMDRYMGDTFREAGIRYLETYFCPHHDDYGKCLCRKPLPGMIEKAIARHGVDREKSWMIGDKERDIRAAADAGIRGIRIATNGNLRPVTPRIIGDS